MIYIGRNLVDLDLDLDLTTARAAVAILPIMSADGRSFLEQGADPLLADETDPSSQLNIDLKENGASQNKSGVGEITSDMRQRWTRKVCTDADS